MKLALMVSLTLNFVLVCLVLLLANRMGYLGRLMVALDVETMALPTDTLASRPEWQEEVSRQVSMAQNQRYRVCLLGDSISSGLGNTLGDNTFNFAIAGMSSISQLEQLKLLVQAQVSCSAIVLAIGTNDAAYRTTDSQFVKNVKTIIAQGRTRLGANQVALLPAFYSTAEASRDPSLAGPLSRVIRINDLIQKIAVEENVLIANEGLQALFERQALKQNLTVDGVHLNPDGEKIYRGALLKAIARLSTHNR